MWLKCVALDQHCHGACVLDTVLGSVRRLSVAMNIVSVIIFKIIVIQRVNTQNMFNDVISK